MFKQETIDRLREIIEGYLTDTGLELIELIYRHEGRDLFLRVIIDRTEGGISLGECARVNSEISAILDEKGIPEERYILEVSSPGLDRPLATAKDFARCLKRKARFFLNEPVNGKIEWCALINAVTDNEVEVDIEGMTLKIPLSRINKAKQVVE